MAKRLISSALLTVALLQPAHAQSDLLTRGKSLFDSLSTPGTAGAGGASASLSDSDIGAGLKEALRIGSDNVVGQLGRTNGFNTDPKIHIPLPASLQSVQQTLGRVGMSGMLDDLELRLNRAAEAATPKAKAIFHDAIAAMRWEDVRDIQNGADDSATQYLKSKMSAPLKAEMRPVVDSSLAEVGAINSYDAVMGQYKSMPFVPDVKADLTEHVLDRGLDGMFLYLAAEEAAIRQNPAKRTTELLQKVFSGS
jgi:hypothetical protein